MRRYGPLVADGDREVDSARPGPHATASAPAQHAKARGHAVTPGWLALASLLSSMRRSGRSAGHTPVLFTMRSFMRYRHWQPSNPEIYSGDLFLKIRLARQLYSLSPNLCPHRRRDRHRARRRRSHVWHLRALARDRIPYCSRTGRSTPGAALTWLADCHPWLVRRVRSHPYRRDVSDRAIACRADRAVCISRTPASQAGAGFHAGCLRSSRAPAHGTASRSGSWS